MGTLQVDQSRCVRCGICVKICPVSAINLAPGAFPAMDNVKKLFCINCGQCEAYCPKHALGLSVSGYAPAALSRTNSCPSPEELGSYLHDRRSVRMFRPEAVDR